MSGQVHALYRGYLSETSDQRSTCVKVLELLSWADDSCRCVFRWDTTSAFSRSSGYNLCLCIGSPGLLLGFGGHRQCSPQPTDSSEGRVQRRIPGSRDAFEEM
ncbi:hypothetical protein TNCT_534551 [Trichonephila clavata]|uniref:Uncharacterized protein n=1 Tax=Trichonephila clavata TaxID=2740835 RepID=A0A8X6JAP4_TRICU|nr:hypothetical protein TNCT_534551 [Trichonephila clavata]